MTERVAFWVDMQDPYVTYDIRYIETVWWIVKQLWDKGLVYQGRRVTPHCPRCGTTLSSHEVALGYKENTPDPSIYVKFRIVPESAPASLRPHLAGPACLLAWTTTPWTLPGNTALSVNAGQTYSLVRLAKSGEVLLLARALLDKALRDEYTVLAEAPGADLAGMRYEPLYPPAQFGAPVLRFPKGSPVAERVAAPPEPLTCPVVTAEFVSMEDGTGIVHTAPAFGEDDYNAGVANGLYFVQPVKLNGEFEGTYPWTGKFVKRADPAIMDELKSRGLLYRRETIKHTYPFCWRCDSPLLYYAKSSWYLRTTAVKDRLVEANQAIGWRPEHIKDGRFGEWLRGNVDWAISRERFWGTPWPVWECAACRKHECIGSVEELRAKPGVQGMPAELDLHRPHVDRVTFRCAACGGTMARVPEVMDVWFDSGAMPLAQWHYPFENKALVETGGWYPADYICEAVDQTRGWFYSLHAIATLLEAATAGRLKAPCYRSVICLGHILDSKGEKMSKSRGNVVRPAEVIDAHGADAVRWYLYTATRPGDSRRFSTQLVAEAVRKFLLTLWNTYSFFVTYANIDGWQPAKAKDGAPASELDRWVVSRLHTLVDEVTQSMDDFDPTTASRKIEAFVDDLSNWYVRRSRRRFWKPVLSPSSLLRAGSVEGSESDDDKAAAYRTLYECLVTLSKLLAPFTPFVAEEMYQNLVLRRRAGAPESVHLADYPVADAAHIDRELERRTDLVIKAVSLGRAARSKSKIKIRQPLQRLVVAAAAPGDREAILAQQAQVRDELNVKQVEVTAGEAQLVTYRVKGLPSKLGPKFGREMGKVMAAIAGADAKAVALKVQAGAAVEIGDYALEPGDLEVTTEDQPGLATASDGPLTVAVSTAVTPELALEGLARELVHRIQTMRRSAGFEISDRIVTHYEADDATARAFETHGAYIRQETLSERLVRGPAPAEAYAEAQEIDGASVRLAVVRAAQRK